MKRIKIIDNTEIEKARELVIKEVVEWIMNNFIDVTGQDSVEQIWAIPKYKLKSKLKDWGYDILGYKLDKMKK